DQFAAFFWQVCHFDTETATVLGKVLLHGGAFGESAIGDGEDVGFFVNDGHGEEFVVFAEFHAAYSGCATSHGAQGFIGGGETQRWAVARDEDEVKGVVDEL